MQSRGAQASAHQLSKGGPHLDLCHFKSGFKVLILSLGLSLLSSLLSSPFISLLHPSQRSAAWKTAYLLRTCLCSSCRSPCSQLGELKAKSFLEKGVRHTHLHALAISSAS